MNIFQFPQQLYEVNIHGFEGTDDCKATTLEYLTNIYQHDSQKKTISPFKEYEEKIDF